MSTRRSTRRTAASAEPSPPALQQSPRDRSPAVEPPRRRGRKSKAAAAAVAQVEAQSATQSQSTSRPNATSRATSASTTIAAVSKRTTRAAKAAGDGSPLRVYQPPERRRKRARGQSAGATPEPTQSEPAPDEDEDDDQGIFFSKTVDHPSPSPSPSEIDHLSSLHDDSTAPPCKNDNKVALKAENEALRHKTFQLEARIIELEKANFNLVHEKERVVSTYDGLLDKIASLEFAAQKHPRPSSLFSLSSTPCIPESPAPPFAQPPSPLVSQSPSPHFLPWAARSSQRASPPILPSLSRYSHPTPSRFSQSNASHFSHPPSSPIPQPASSPISQSAAPHSTFKVDIPKHIDDMFAAMAANRWDYKTNNIKANIYDSEFDAQLLNLPTTSPARPMFVNSSESAIALLTKIENAAKEPLQCDKSVTEDGSSLSDADVNMERAPQLPSTKRTYEESATPARPITVPSSFFTRSFSAIKSIKSLFSTPATKAAPPPDSLTEALSAPPTPVGERTWTPAKKRKIGPMMRTLLKGIDPADERKAEEWARQVVPCLKNDNAFLEKRKRLETPVLVKDLINFPAAKPWETGFGDPLAEMEDEDVVPVWAVYLDMVAEEEERGAKKHKSTHRANMDSEDVPTINERYAASQSAQSSRRLFNSHGQTASELDYHPRRSIVPSPMFDTSLSHHQGSNVFNELQGHDTAAKIRTNDREVLQSAINTSEQTHNPGIGSFSVPEDSDDDSTVISETDNNVGPPATPIWTQAPPPAPVPAHAPLPGGAAGDAASTATTEKPVDEIERQRQRLMKHTPAKPSRLREASYPSPSLLSDAGNESIMMATPAQTAAAMTSIFGEMPTAELIELNDEEQADFDAIVASDTYKQQLAAPWAPAIITYDSDEEDLSPS